MPDAKVSVVEALNAVMVEVEAIGKSDRNKAQGFDFRGIDTVLNVVGPVFRKHGVVVVPRAQEIETESYSTKNGTAMRNIVVKVDYTFYGPAGDSIESTVYGEASDSGDKAVSKAMSVAMRIALLQALSIPTDEPDPDSESHERAGRTSSPAAKPEHASAEDVAAIQAAVGFLDPEQVAEFGAWWQAEKLPADPTQITPAEAARVKAKLNITES